MNKQCKQMINSNSSISVNQTLVVTATIVNKLASEVDDLPIQNYQKYYW